MKPYNRGIKNNKYMKSHSKLTYQLILKPGAYDVTTISGTQPYKIGQQSERVILSCDCAAALLLTRHTLWKFTDPIIVAGAFILHK